MKIWQAGGRFLFGRILPRISYPVLRGPLRGRWFILGATAGDAGGVSVHLGLQEVEQSRCLERLLRPGQVFFDVGANVGFYSLLASRAVGPDGRVIAFEPLPRNLAFLFRHTVRNKARNVTILPLACAAGVAVESFLEGDNNALGRLGEHEQTAVRSTPLLVATVSLDEVARRLDAWPDVIKIDVEGAELQVLEGAKEIFARSKPVILLSVHSAQLREACLAHLAALNYRAEPVNAESMESATELLARPAGSAIRR